MTTEPVRRPKLPSRCLSRAYVRHDDVWNLTTASGAVAALSLIYPISLDDSYLEFEKRFSIIL